jgi:CIC family chloride channel protein
MMFAVELTGDAALIMPLLAACGASYAFTVLLLKRSILTEKVARRGYHIMRELSVDPLDLAQMRDVMVTDVDTPRAEMTVGRRAGWRRWSRAPNVLSFVKDTSRHSQTLVEVLGGRKLVIGYPHEPVSSLTYRRVQQDVGRVPIVGPADNRLLGLVARKDLLRVRARLLSEERERRRVMAFGRLAVVRRVTLSGRAGAVLAAQPPGQPSSSRRTEMTER